MPKKINVKTLVKHLEQSDLIIGHLKSGNQTNHIIETFYTNDYTLGIYINHELQRVTNKSNIMIMDDGSIHIPNYIINCYKAKSI